MDRWPTERVDYNWIRMQGTAKYRKEQQDEYEAENATGTGTGTGGAGIPGAGLGSGGRPDGVSERAWKHMPHEQRQRILQNRTAGGIEGHENLGGTSEAALEQHLERMEQIDTANENQNNTDTDTDTNTDG